MLRLSQGTAEQKRMAQGALDRWWWPSLMMFGPSDADSKHTARSMRWKIKRFTNDALREKFVDATVPQAEHLGLKIPDPDLSWNEATQHFQTGEIDWNELKQVLAGNGPCNQERLSIRIRAHEEGAWVRQAALDHAAKHSRGEERIEIGG
jgi:ring-1,2-phenylacetyl-CoA epoxidase subunit PaaA